MRRDAFFSTIRGSVFDGRLAQGQVDGTNAILDEWERRKLTDIRWLAYMLATAKWETAHTMQPIKEYGGPAYFKKMYDVEGDRPDLARRHGNTEPGDGARYCGRGYVQLTWRNNYRTMGDLLGVDLEAHPDMAMRRDIAAKIMFEGMIRGSFTGKKLSDYFLGAKSDWVEARRIINGLDRAKEIAELGQEFHRCIVAASAGAPAIPPPPDIEPPPKPAEVKLPPLPKPGERGNLPPSPTFWAAVMKLFGKG
jgi:putative chitinase